MALCNNNQESNRCTHCYPLLRPGLLWACTAIKNSGAPMYPCCFEKTLGGEAKPNRGKCFRTPAVRPVVEKGQVCMPSNSGDNSELGFQLRPKVEVSGLGCCGGTRDSSPQEERNWKVVMGKR